MSNLSLPFQIREVTVFPLLPWQRFMLRQTGHTLLAISPRLLGRMMTPFGKSLCPHHCRTGTDFNLISVLGKLDKNQAFGASFGAII